MHTAITLRVGNIRFPEANIFFIHKVLLIHEFSEILCSIVVFSMFTNRFDLFFSSIFFKSGFPIYS